MSFSSKYTDEQVKDYLVACMRGEAIKGKTYWAWCVQRLNIEFKKAKIKCRTYHATFSPQGIQLSNKLWNSGYKPQFMRKNPITGKVEIGTEEDFALVDKLHMLLKKEMKKLKTLNSKK